MSLEENSESALDELYIDRDNSPFAYDNGGSENFDQVMIPQEGGNAGYDNVVIGGVMDDSFVPELFSALDRYDVDENGTPLDVYLLDNEAFSSYLDDIANYGGVSGVFASPDEISGIERPTLAVDMNQHGDPANSLSEELAHFKAFERGWNSISNRVSDAVFDVLDRKSNVSPKTGKIRMSMNRGIKEAFSNSISYEKGGVSEVEENFSNVDDVSRIQNFPSLSTFKQFEFLTSCAEDVYPQNVDERESLIQQNLQPQRDELEQYLSDIPENVVNDVFDAYENIEMPPEPHNLVETHTNLVNLWLTVNSNPNALMSAVSPQEIVYEFKD